MTVIANNDAHIAKKKAAAYFGNGLHCAEAVVAAVLQAIGKESALAISHATAFGGGFGKTFTEACGALSGGLIVIGHIHGRITPGEDWDFPAFLGDELRQRFICDFATTHCASLRERFGEEHQMDECRKIVGEVSKTLVELLIEQENSSANSGVE